MAAGELVPEALPLEEVAHEEEAQTPPGKLAKLRGQEAGDVRPLRDLGDLVGSVLDLLAALARGDALHAAGEESDAPEAGVVAEPSRQAADGADREVGPEPGPGSRNVLEEDLAKAFHGLHELVDGGGGPLAASDDAATCPLLLARGVRALGQGVEFAHEGLHGGRRRCWPALAFLRETGERGELLADGVHLLRPLAEGRVALLFGKKIDGPRVQSIEELVLELLPRGIALGRRGEIAGFAMEQEVPARYLAVLHVQVDEVSALSGIHPQRGDGIDVLDHLLCRSRAGESCGLRKRDTTVVPRGARRSGQEEEQAADAAEVVRGRHGVPQSSVRKIEVRISRAVARASDGSRTSASGPHASACRTRPRRFRTARCATRAPDWSVVSRAAGRSCLAMPASDPRNRTAAAMGGWTS